MLKFKDMKRTTFIIGALILIMTTSCGVSALAAQMPDNGFWEVITKETGPARTTVKFYDMQKHLIYEEHVEGVRLDPAKRKTCRLLNKVLKTALVAWEDNRRMTPDKGIVAAVFR